MSEVTLRWLQRAASRDVGDEETVELTDFVKAIIEQGRVEVISEAEPVVADSTEMLAPRRRKFVEPSPDEVFGLVTPESE